MAFLIEWVDQFDALARLLMQALLNSLWQGVLLTALVGTLLFAYGRVFKQASATTRHALWFVTLCALLCLPGLALVSGWQQQRQAVRQAQVAQAQRERALAAWRTARARLTIPVRIRPLATEAVNVNPGQPGQPTQPVQSVVAAAGVPLAESFKPSMPASMPALSNVVAPVLTSVDRVERPVGATALPSLQVAAARWRALLAQRWQGLSDSVLRGSLPLFLVALWGAIALALLAQLGRSFVTLQRTLGQMNEAAAPLSERVAQLAAQFKLRRTVRLLMSDDTTAARLVGPLTIGWRKPLVVVPVELAMTLSPAECDSVLTHELAHIQRCDYATNLVQRVAQCLLFFHPAIWFINKQLVIERELACDDWVVKLTGEPRRYAGCLTKMVELLSAHPTFATAPGVLFAEAFFNQTFLGKFQFRKHIITRRVEMILNRNRNAATAVSKPALASAISLAAVLVFFGSTLAQVIAVPVQQKPASGKTVKATTAAPVAPRPAIAVPPGAVAVAEFTGDESRPLDVTNGDVTNDVDVTVATSGATIPSLAPLPALAELAALDAARAEELVELTAPATANLVNLTAELAWQDGPARTATTIPASPVAPVAPVAASPRVAATVPRWPAPAAAPFDATTQSLEGFSFGGGPATSFGFTGQGSSNSEKRTPTIPEEELLKLLVDIVKRDADPQVRAEALSGIYRMRSEAAANALLDLYDAVSDPKTKADILSRFIRRTGDNKRAIAKLVQIAKTEKDETLLGRALTQLAYVKGDEGADHLIQIFDGSQDPKIRQRVVRALAYNKSKKAVDKLFQVAKSDSDPQTRQAALRSLANIDNGSSTIGLLGDHYFPANISGLVDSSVWQDLNGKLQLDQKRLEEIQSQAQEKMREAQERMRDRQRELIERDRERGARSQLEREQLEKEKEKIKEKNKNEEKQLNEAPTAHSERQPRVVRPARALTGAAISL